MADESFAPERFARVKQARDPKTPRERLLALRSDPDPAVRATLFANPAFPAQWAEWYAHLELRSPQCPWPVRQAIAWSSLVSAAILRKVAKGGEWYVLIALANNPNTPHDMLVVLAAMPDREISAIAKRRLAEGRYQSLQRAAE